ncbi:beta-mannanase [Paenibacillus sinopodophylli]|uniref:beta-mannanase n=1 Tax=Paenibacillus sinopodophylli TaxID=1837342 RepID=UPI00110CC5DA|nr:beta-mannanase [Paenibacillus sinopodophylli]
MRFVVAEDGAPAISGLTRFIEEDHCTLRWNWPSGIDAVYIEKTAVDHSEDASETKSGLKLYTRAEYKANNGYHSRIDGFGLVAFTVYACQESSDGPRLLEQPNQENRIEISAGRAKIHYSVVSRSGLFRKFKSVQIQVTAEVPIAKEVLCYVKKQGGYPASKDDGVLYPFVAPFTAGRNILPAIEIGKQEFIRLFFTDGRIHGQMYELISV